MKIAFYLQPNVEILDFAGPMEVFDYAGFEIFTVSETTRPILSQGILKIIPDYDLENAPSADILAFFGGNSETGFPPKVIDWIKKQSNIEFYFSVCTGVFALAKAGLLDGKAVTTFHSELGRLEHEFPSLKVVRDARFVDNDNIITTAGVSAGIDGALHLVSKIKGKETAQKVSQYMEYDKWQPDEGLIA